MRDPSPHSTSGSSPGSRPNPSPIPVSLAVTSSTGVMSIAVGDREKQHSIDVATERRHAEELIPLLQRLLSDAGVAITDLQRLVVDVGPGRFTGLRVGVATIRALSFALRVPVVPVTSLELLAYAGSSLADQTPSTVTAVIDARRQEVFQQRFVDGRPAAQAQVGKPEELAVAAAGLVVGDGVDRYRKLYEAQAVTVQPEVHPRASDAIELASARHASPGVDITPLYLRDPDAVANIRTRLPQVQP